MSLLLKEKSEHILTLTLNRPEMRNSLNAKLMGDMISTLEEAKLDTDIHVIVIRGAGEKAFCSGADLGNIGEKANVIDMRTHLSHYANLIIALNNVGKPTIAAVQGYA